MRLASRWIRVLFSALVLGVAVGTVVHFASPQQVLLANEDGGKGNGGG